jgi:glycosyltransferase involved in cell wall biosynthesis
MPRRTKVLLIHNIVAPYRLPLFRALANEGSVDLTVWFMSQSARNRVWRPVLSSEVGFAYEILPKLEFNYISNDLFTYILNYSFPWRYVRQPFDLMIAAGWLDFASQAGFLLSKLLGRRYILWSESTANESSWRRSLARPLVQTIVAGSDAYIAVGTRSKEYLCALGAPEDDIFTAFSTVDVHWFQCRSRELALQRDAIKAELGIAGRRVVLYCGQFIERKGLRYLVEAFELIKARHPDTALAFVGYGPLQSELQATVARRRLADVHFLGAMELEDTARVYAVSDVFVLPSLEETWGLVVNEAMACGLPVVVTDCVGSSVDLVRNGENGFVVPAGDAVRLGDAISHLVADNSLRERFSACSARHIANFTPEHAASAFAAAVQHAMRRPDA